ncbi:MAG: SsrA-binding protein SmpB [Candidatus Riflebacteria bacterium]|nr:SsrA-binding protein SmpB [Candidatus Riflebacteria bacterium]
MARREASEPLLIKNKKAFHLYEIVEKIEAGIELVGTEVKAIRAKNVNFTDAFVRMKNGEAFLENLHIGAWAPASQFNHAPLRSRRLLLHKNQIMRLGQKCAERGLTLVPLAIVGRKHWIKVELGLGRGKKVHDKRDSLARKEAKRDVERDLKYRSR